MLLKGQRFFFAGVLLLVTAACSSTQNYTYEEVPSVIETPAACHISPRSRIRLKAEGIRFISSYNPLGRAPNVEQELLVVPEQVIHKWAENRFVTTGNSDVQVRFIIKDAGITGRGIVTGSCFKEIKAEYTGRFEVTIQFVDSNGLVLVEATKAVQKSDIVANDLTPAEQEDEWMLLTYHLVKKLSDELDKDLCSHSFNDYIER